MYSLAYYFPIRKEYVRVELIESSGSGRIIVAIYPMLNFQVPEELMRGRVRAISKELRFNYFSTYTETELEALTYAMNSQINEYLGQQEKEGRLVNLNTEHLSENQTFELYYGKPMIVSDDGMCLTNPYTYLFNTPTNVRH